MLMLHLLFAVPTIFLSLISIFHPKRSHTLPLHLLTLPTFVSGTILSIESHSPVAVYCLRIGLYLSLIVAAHLRINRVLDRSSVTFDNSPISR